MCHALYVIGYNEEELSTLRNYARDVPLTGTSYIAFIKGTDLSQFSVGSWLK